MLFGGNDIESPWLQRHDANNTCYSLWHCGKSVKLILGLYLCSQNIIILSNSIFHSPLCVFILFLLFYCEEQGNKIQSRHGMTFEAL